MIGQDKFFLARCEELSRLALGATELDIVDTSRVLRALLLDSHPLMDIVNTGRLKITFVVGLLRKYPEEERPFFQSIEDGFDPQTMRMGPTMTVKRDALLKAPVMTYHGRVITVRDVILYSANVLGGVHRGRPDANQEAIDIIANAFVIGGVSAGVRNLKAISRVVVRGLEPLIADVRSRIGPIEAPS